MTHDYLHMIFEMCIRDRNAGLCSQILVDRYHVSGIINTGIAGSLRNEVNVGDIVLATDAVQHDMDAAGFGYQPGEIPQMGIKEFPADAHLREVAVRCCQRANPDIQTFCGRVASGDQFINSREKKNWIRDTFDAVSYTHLLPPLLPVCGLRAWGPDGVCDRRRRALSF